MKLYGILELWHTFLTVALDGGDEHFHALAALPAGKEPLVLIE
jgi:hypothetical protein